MSQWKKIESLERVLNMGTLFIMKVHCIILGERMIFAINGAETTEYSHGENYVETCIS